MESNDFFSALVDLGFWTFVKLVILASFLLYIAFAFVLVRQEQLMTRFVEIKGFPLLKLAVFIHFIAAIVVFLLALFLL